MEFRNFLDKNWDANDYCNLLALHARRKAREIMTEMAMGAQNISKMPVFHDKDTWKFLQQFPAEVWRNALHWLYNEGLVRMMKEPREYGEIPEGWDWTSKVEFDDPNRPGSKKWVFESPDGSKNIWIGLSKLAHKLSHPPKQHKGMTEEDLPEPSRRYWAGNEGPAIGEIDPKQTDPEHPEHVSKYKHGMYDFDFEDLAEATPESIDDKPDWEIQQLLKQEFRDRPLSDPEVKTKIKQKREAMKQVLKSSFAGYDVLQKGIAGASLTNWIRANALPEKPYGEVPSPGEQIRDPLNPHKVHEVEHLNPNQIKKEMHGRWDLTAGHNKTPLNIPAIKKTFHYKILDNKTKKETPVTDTSYIPVLNDVKSIPRITLSSAQKEDLLKRKTEKGLASFEDLQGMLAHWDLLTPEQKDYVKANSKSAFEVAQTYHNKDASLGHRVDPRAELGNVTVAGFRPNYKTQERPYLSLPKEKLDEFINKYKGIISGEVLNPAKDEKGKSIGQVDRILESFRMYGKNHPEVIEALRNRIAEVGEVITYNLLTWMDDPRYGIKDDDLGLLKNVDWDDYDAEANKERREILIYNYLSSMAQIGFAGVPPRRIREKYGMPTTTSANKPVGDSGKSLEGEIEQGAQGKQKNIKNDPVRAALFSGPESVIRAGQKPHQMFDKFGIWLASNRHRILKQLPSAQVKEGLEEADKNIIAALQVGYELYDKFDKQLSSQIEDPAELEKKVMELVHMHLPAALKQHLGDLPDPEHESLLTKIKGIGNIGPQKMVSMKMDAKAKEVYDKFLDELSTAGEARLPMFNTNTNEFEETSSVMNISNVKPDNPLLVIQIIDNLYPAQFENLKRSALKEKGPALYDAIESEHEIDKSKEQTTKEYEIALLKWNAEKATQQQQQQQPTPMPQPVAQPAAAAAKALSHSLPELFALAAKVGNSEDVVKLGQAFLDKKAELMAQPGSAARLEQAVDAMRERRKLSMHQSPPSQQEYKIFQQLPHLVAELEAAHE